MKQQLSENGFCKNYFPFNEVDIETLKLIAKKLSKLELNRRKNIFQEFPEVRILFQRAVESCALNLELSDYCFFIEKTDEKNWPLLFHRDINLPEYLNIQEEEKENFLKKSVMFRLTLDYTDKDTGALKVIAGSHVGRDKEEEFINTEEGEVIFFKPLLLHGSNKMKKPHTRRVFQALCIETS